MIIVLSLLIQLLDYPQRPMQPLSTFRDVYHHSSSVWRRRREAVILNGKEQGLRSAGILTRMNGIVIIPEHLAICAAYLDSDNVFT